MAGALVAAGLAAGLAAAHDRAIAAVALAMALYLPLMIALPRLLGRSASFGWANRITLVRAAMTCGLAGLLVEPVLFEDRAISVVAVVLLVLALDGVDGWLARRLGETSRIGARFDMETDAALIVVLCVALWLSNLAPLWVMAIGLMRPAFILAGRLLPWLRHELPQSLRRKIICVLQVAVLPVAFLPLLSNELRIGLLGAALLSLIYSFAVDSAWLFRHRHAKGNTQWRMS
jgi:phosphatidylglycerophosphate synthase